MCLFVFLLQYVIVVWFDSVCCLLIVFQMSMIEIHLEPDIPPSLLIIFTLCTALVVTINLTSLFISTCILSHLDAMASDRENPAALAFGASWQLLASSPHIAMRHYIKMSWILSTGVGILLFLVQIAIVGWVRLDRLSRLAAIVTTAIIIPAIAAFVVFAVQFYRHLIAYKYANVTCQLMQLEDEVRNLDFEDRSMTSTV
jgi:calcium release-activated calcium channel protein 1